jgi:hypothetical protein
VDRQIPRHFDTLPQSPVVKKIVRIRLLKLSRSGVSPVSNDYWQLGCPKKDAGLSVRSKNFGRSQPGFPHIQSLAKTRCSVQLWHPRCMR